MKTSTKAAEPEVIHLRSEGEEIFLAKAWPPQALIAHVFVEHHYITLRWPYLTLRLANAHATYRVGTCERGVWTGTLVEGWWKP